MRHREVCSLRESQKFSLLLKLCCSAMCSLPLLLFFQLCYVSFCGCMNWKGENSKELED